VQRLTTRYWLGPEIFFIGSRRQTASMLSMRVTCLPEAAGLWVERQ
jgi:hypothetical protein